MSLPNPVIEPVWCFFVWCVEYSENTPSVAIYIVTNTYVLVAMMSIRASESNVLRATNHNALD